MDGALAPVTCLDESHLCQSADVPSTIHWALKVSECDAEPECPDLTVTCPVPKTLETGAPAASITTPAIQTGAPDAPVTTPLMKTGSPVESVTAPLLDTGAPAESVTTIFMKTGAPSDSVTTPSKTLPFIPDGKSPMAARPVLQPAVEIED